MTGGLAASDHRVPGWPEDDHETDFILLPRRQRVNFARLSVINEAYGVLRPSGAFAFLDLPSRSLIARGA